MARALLNAKLTKLLGTVATESSVPPGYSFRTMTDMQPVIDAGNKPDPKTPFVTWNTNITAPGDASKIAFVPTEAGKAYIATAAEVQAAKPERVPADPNAPKPAFEIETVEEDELPALKTRGRRESVYPFSELTAPVNNNGKKAFASFFVPAPEGTTADAMFKKFGSTVSSATKRYNKDGSTDKRKFTHRASDKNGQPGVRIYRVE